MPCDHEGGSTEKEKLEQSLRVGYQAGSIFGGVLTLIGCIIIASQVCVRFLQISRMNEHTSVKEETVAPDYSDERLDLKLSNFEDSFNFIIGMQLKDDDEEDFDILDNKYFEVVAYEAFSSESGAVLLEEKYELERCSTEY